MPVHNYSSPQPGSHHSLVQTLFARRSSPSMSSEQESSDQSPIERLMSPRSRAVRLFLPFVLGLTSSPPDPSEIPEDPARSTPETPSARGSRDRILLIDPAAQVVVVIEGNPSSPGLDPLLRNLLGKSGQPPASRASIEGMPTVVVGEAGGECAICLEEWGVGDEAREMPCKHRFHVECVGKWLRIHGSCPVCRYKMPVDGDGDLGEKDEGEERTRMRRGIWVGFSLDRERGVGSEDSSQPSSD